jgi:hypothetical protein
MKMNSQNTDNTIAEAITVIDFTADRHLKRMRKEAFEYLAFKQQKSKAHLMGEALDLLISCQDFSEDEIRSYYGDRAIPLLQAMTEMKQRGVEKRAAAKDAQAAAA